MNVQRSMPTLHARLRLVGSIAAGLFATFGTGRAESVGPPHAVSQVLPLRSAVSADGFIASNAGLPDSPGYAFSSSNPQSAETKPRPLPAGAPQIAPRSQFILKPGQAAQPLAVRDKFAFATRNALSPLEFFGSVASAGISHATDSRPHLGTDSAGFGERLGVTVYRGDVKSIFGFGVFPAIFHDDPRFYVLGDTVAFKQRVLYAATRVVIARKDSGARGINYPRLLAPIVSQGSVNGFYPSRDRDITNTVTGILLAYVTSAGSDELKEFREDILRRIHLKH